MTTTLLAALDAVEHDLVEVPAGTITLRDEAHRRDGPTVQVAPFRLSKHQLTRGLFAAITGQPLPSSPSLPMTEVSWNDAVAFCNRLSMSAGLTPCYSGLGDREAHDVVVDVTASGYRLPMEAEWEHACRAGSNDVRYGALDEIAWYVDNADGRLHDVGLKQPNAWGLFDMIGNAWEWCHDVYDPVVYGGYRVFRGGGFADAARGCRASCRRKSHPTYRIDDVGLRLAAAVR